MNNIVDILMKRDNMTQEDAEALVNETRDEIMMLDDPMQADDIIMNYLGLEPDYLFDLLA